MQGLRKAMRNVSLSSWPLGGDLNSVHTDTKQKHWPQRRDGQKPVTLFI
jgi:hypothetical protein